MIVMKFGGTSVESAVAMQRLAGIVSTRAAQRPLVVVSAMGKTTNRLLAVAQQAVRNQRETALRGLQELLHYHEAEARAAELADYTELCQAIRAHFSELAALVQGLSVLGELTPRSLDAIASYGERLSSLIVTSVLRQAGLPAIHVDARTVLVTDQRYTHAAPLFAETNERLASRVAPLLSSGQVPVLGGFMGATLEGVTTTLGRGGSDYSASIIGAGLSAEEIQIWTDVDGMLTADPTILPGGYRVKRISFAEAAELAYFGAKVLHPATVLPAVDKNIPVLILNSRRPEAPGTRITAAAVPCANVVKSIACKKNITLLNIQSTRMLMATGFLQRIFEVFARYETSVDMVATSEVSVSLTIDDAVRLPEITAELREIAELAVDDGLAIVSLVGDNLRETPGLAGRVFQALGSLPVRMISQGASLLNLSFVVRQADLRTAVAELHAEFFAEPDPTVFEPVAA